MAALAKKGLESAPEDLQSAWKAMFERLNAGIGNKQLNFYEAHQRVSNLMKLKRDTGGFESEWMHDVRYPSSNGEFVIQIGGRKVQVFFAPAMPGSGKHDWHAVIYMHPDNKTF